MYQVMIVKSMYRLMVGDITIKVEYFALMSYKMGDFYYFLENTTNNLTGII